MPELLWERFRTLPVAVPDDEIEMDVVLASDEWHPAWLVITGGRCRKVEAVYDPDAARTFGLAFRVFGT